MPADEGAISRGRRPRRTGGRRPRPIRESWQLRGRGRARCTRPVREMRRLVSERRSADEGASAGVSDPGYRGVADPRTIRDAPAIEAGVAEPGTLFERCAGWGGGPRVRGCVGRGQRPRLQPPKRRLHRLQRAVALGGLHAFAGALGDIFPGMRVVVDGRGARAAGAGAGGAIVLAGQRDAVALVGAGLGRGGAGLGGGGERRGRRRASRRARRR